MDRSSLRASPLFSILPGFFLLCRQIKKIILSNVKILKIVTPKIIAIIVIKMKHFGLQYSMCPRDTDGMANCVDPE